MRTLSMRAIVAVLAIVSMLSAGRPTAAADDDLSPEIVRKAIKRGRSYLVSKQQDDGSWSAFSDKVTTGVTSLALLALLESGMKPIDPPVRKGLAYLRRQPLPDQTYNASLMVMAYVAAKDAGDKNRIVKLIAALEKGQIKQGNNAGSWTYQLNGDGIRGGDRSNAQFAILALRDAVYAGVKVKRETWMLARKHWTDQQNADGSWGYTGRFGSGTGSMTVAGIATMVITARMLREDQHVDAQGRPNCCRHREPDKSLAAAIRWLGKHFDTQGTAVKNFNSRSHLFYYLCALERAGRQSGHRFFGSKHDWYREGAKFFLKTANLPDGEWTGTGLGEHQPVIGTSMAVLFLSKGLAPVLVNKLKYGPQNPRGKDDIVGNDWNLHPRDASQLVEYTAQQARWPRSLTWQTVEMQKLVNHGGDVDVLDQANVLLITGSKDPAALRQPSQARILKNYIKRGGFIFVVGNCAKNSTFDVGFKQLVKTMFPDKTAELKRLPAAHPVYHSEFQLAKNQADWNKTELYGVDSGGRTAIVYAPAGVNGVDLSCLWAQRTLVKLPRRPRELSAMVERSLQIGVNVLAYATGRTPSPKRLSRAATKAAVKGATFARDTSLGLRSPGTALAHVLP